MEKEKNILEDVMEELLDEFEEVIDPIEEDEEIDDDVELEDEVEDEDDEFVILEEEEELKPVKPTREEKEQYAFEKLRKENKEKEAQLKELEDIAHSYGFSSHEEMLVKLREEAEQKQAREKNIDPEIYKTLKEQERELKRIREEREEEKMKLSANTVVNRVNGFKEKHNLDDSDIENLLHDLDSDGFTIEQLSKINNYEKLFTGYLRDTIIEKEKQARLNKEKRKSKLSENKLDGTGNETEYTLDDLIGATIERNRTKY